jgi:lipopolysaccharide export system protein LptA
MPLPVYHLRRLLAITTIALIVVVTGMYFSARLQIRDVRREVPNKLGYDISKTATGFQISKSDGKRTLFSVHATDVKEFKLNGRAELHNVTILLYGRDSSRFDQIYGDDFAYDPKSGEVTAKGDVQIDLVANPAGLVSPDQSTPKELKNPIHLRTRDLVFNKDTGNASTDARVEFSMAQATGWAVGVNYAGKSNTLTLSSQIHLALNGENAAVIEAEHGVITNDPREVVLDHPHLDREASLLEADQAIFHLGEDNNVESVRAIGNVIAENRVATGTAKPQAGQASGIRTRSDQAELLLTGKRDFIRTAVLTGNVQVEQSGVQPIQGEAGRVLLEFRGQNQLRKVHALDGARLTQKATGAKQPTAGSGPQDFELSASAIDFNVAEGHILDRAETSGAAKITISSSQEAPRGASQASPPQRTVVTAAKFVAKFIPDEPAKGRKSSGNHLSSIHGAPDARIVSSSAGQPDRVSTSDSVDATFLPQGGIDSVTQLGSVAYTDGLSPNKRTQAWANRAHYTPADQMLVLSGDPRIASISMATTANTVRINRATGAALAEGNVKSTYSELKEQPDGALLASSSPIHVTARTMTAGRTTGVALYTGDVRLWQDANIIAAPSIEFDRDRRFVTAQGSPATPVLTTLIQATKPSSKSGSAPQGKSKSQAVASPVTIASARLTYADSERRVHYEGGVDAKCADFSLRAKTADAYLLSRSQTSNNQSFAGPGQLDRMVAQDGVRIQQPNRRAEGQKLIYTAAEDKFVLTGGPPSIFDAERGKITGVSLTFFRGDDRVLVEGETSTPVVTQTRVAR